MTTGKRNVAFIAAYCEHAGIKHVVVSPGSRSAPLVAAFSQLPAIDCCVIPDERVAGYFALGLAQQTKKPVALICTSGTAVLNLAPALCEAYYLNIPLLALTADRPEGAYLTGENQAINQENIFSSFTRYSSCINGDSNQPENIKPVLENAFSALKDGPVHLNIHLSEPLYEFIEEERFDIQPIVSDVAFGENNNTIHHLVAQAKPFAKKMLIAGLRTSADWPVDLLHKLNERSDFIVVTEPTSNLHLDNSIHHADLCIAKADEQLLKDIAPDVVITLGNQIVSKRLKDFLKKNKPQIHIDIPEGHATSKNRDMFGCLLKSDEAYSEQAFLEALLDMEVVENSNYKKEWLDLSEKTSSLFESYLSGTDWSDLKVFETIISSLPENCSVHYGNSTPVRYASFFNHPSGIEVYSNRGTSGIDGCMSTAAGIAYTNQALTVCVLGDVSFLYDSNALWNNYLSPNLRVIVVNNGGGNIFRLINGPNRVNDFEKYFETTHQLTAEHLASMFRIPYYICTRQSELEETLKTFYQPQNGRPAILEIKTDSLKSAETYKGLFETLKTQS